MKSNLSGFFHLWIELLVSCLKKSLPNPQIFSYVFFNKFQFYVLLLDLCSSLNDWWYKLGDLGQCSFLFCFVLPMNVSNIICLSTFVKNNLAIFVWVYFGFNIVPLSYFSYLLLISHCLDYYCFIVNLKIGLCVSSDFFSFSKLFFLLQFLCLSTDILELACLCLKKRFSQDFVWNYIKFRDHFGEDWHLLYDDSSNPLHVMSLCLFRYSLRYSISIL